MNEIKQAALGICVLAAAAGLFRMLIPCEKYKMQITFAIACIFSVCLINSVTDLIPALSIETQIADIPQVDFSDKLSEQARITAARAVRQKVEELLTSHGFIYRKVYITAHIDGAFCISISEVELVFDDGTDDSYIADAASLVQAAVGDDIKVRYTKER